MKFAHILQVAIFSAFLAGCAGSVSAPVPVQALSAADKGALQLSDVTADADAGVTMSDADFGLVSQKVRAEIEAQSPGIFASKPGGNPLKINIHFTRFDRGSALARAMLMGLGQIKIEATVTLRDAGGKSVAEYKVAKDFALGGIAGATTTVEDVETGFAKSVAAIVK